MEDTQPDSGPSSRSRKEIFETLVRSEVSHGAFRLWHAIFHHGSTSDERFPSQRSISRAIGCKPDSLKPWLIELVEAGWLEVRCEGEKIELRETRREHSKQGRHYTYMLLDGTGKVFPKKGTPYCPKKGNSVFLKKGTECSQKGELTPYRPKRSGRVEVEKLSVLDLKDRLQEVRNRMKELSGQHLSDEGLNHRWDSEEARKEHVELRHREKELQKAIYA